MWSHWLFSKRMLVALRRLGLLDPGPEDQRKGWGWEWGQGEESLIQGPSSGCQRDLPYYDSHARRSAR